MSDETVIRRGRPHDIVPSERVRIEGLRKRGVNARDDKTFAWLDAIPNKKRFAFVWDLVTAALNGELGPVMQQAVEDSDMEKAREAAAQIAGAFVVDDDE
jgi:hypothetical protein